MIRAYDARNAADIDRICIATAAAGGDAAGLQASDEIWPDVFARPYLVFEADLARIVDVHGVGGYVLGTSDTAAFVAWWRESWTPYLAERYAGVDDGVLDLGLDPDRMLIPELDEYPAHLHIDLEPRLQGSGWGRRLIDEFCATVDAPGVHLSMDPLNVAARAFYDRLGFVELPSSTAAEPRLGLRLR